MIIIKYKYTFLTVSALLVLASVAVIFIFGLKQGIDFAGGTLWQIKFADSKITSESVSQELDAADVSLAEKGSLLIKLKEIDEAEHQRLVKKLQDEFGAMEELSFESIGSSIGQELKTKAIWAFSLVLLAISFYIAFAFRKVSRPVSSWKYGLITLLTLFHDAIIPTGLMAFLGWWRGADVGVNFVVAILVVIGFSVHDTIVVFDRIRENLRLEKQSDFDFPNLVGRSVEQTIARSINTSLTLILVLLALYFLGASSLNYFTLIILVGVVFGTYSSIFVASPLLVLWRKRR